MRIPHTDISRPKRTAKLISRVSGRPLSKCQQAIAKGTGYRDWHELERQVSEQKMSALGSYVSLEDQANVILLIAEIMETDLGPVQFASAEGRLFTTEVSDVDVQLTVRGSALRKSSIPYLGKRMRGEIGKINAAGFRTFPVILKSYGAPTKTLTNRSPDTGCADFEYVSPRAQQKFYIPSRLYLAYGQWKEPNGSTVLFSRDYKPMWRLRDGKLPEPVKPSQRIRKVAEEWFWDDTDTPWQNKRRHREEIARLTKLGVRTLPLLVDVLPLLVNRDDVSSIGSAVELHFGGSQGENAT